MRRVPVFLGAILLAMGARAQTAAFDVTSVKPAKAPSRQPPPAACSAGGTYAAIGQGVASSIRWAYGIQAYQLTGLPDWSRKADAVYDIEGKAAGGVDETQCRLLVQALLAERFHLEMHWETRPFPVIALVVGKDGAKIRPAGDSPADNPVRINGARGYGDGKGWTMAQLADFLSRGFPGTPVVDRTGLTGLYGIVFDFDVSPGAPAGASMAAAIQRQLGLRLEERKEPTEFVAIDRLERPSGN
jgi:uncharacterized protein (TIGR03435 family)